MKKTKMMLAAVAIVLGASAATETVDGITWTYTVANGCASVGSEETFTTAVPRVTSGAITIPSNLGGYPVTSIAIGAFWGCTNLTHVAIASSVTRVGEMAFAGCTDLTSVTIPASVVSIGYRAFYRCDNLASVIVDKLNQEYKVVNGMLQTKDGKIVVKLTVCQSFSGGTCARQYKSEAIPVMGNLRTKIGLYQYDKGILPCIATNEIANGEDTGKVSTPQIETWAPVDSKTATTVSANPSEARIYKMASCAFPSGEPPLNGLTVVDHAKGQDSKCRHLGICVDVDPQDLLGKYSRPCHFQHLVMRNGGDHAYVLGCFGDGNGLPAGTGYAICEISSPSTGRKYIGTWERYRSTGDTQICFTSSTRSRDGRPLGCYVPEKSAFDNMTDKGALLKIVDTMKKLGWEF